MRVVIDYLTVAALTFLAAASCVRDSGAAARGFTGQTDATSPPKQAPSESPTVAADLCRGRSDCAVLRNRSARGGERVVDLVLRHRPDAGEDECDRREYWLLGGPTRDSVLLAVDCDRQVAADEAAPAETSLKDGKFVVQYVEFQSSDQCELYQAVVNLETLAVLSQARWEGKRNRDGYRRTRRVTQFAPLGTGKADHPLLRLHVESRDLHPSR